MMSSYSGSYTVVDETVAEETVVGVIGDAVGCIHSIPGLHGSCGKEGL